MNVPNHKFLSVLFTLSTLLFFPPTALCQPSFLKGLISTTNYQVFLSKTGAQYITLEGNQVIFLPGAGASSSPVPIMTGPMGSRWYTDKSGQKQNLPQPQPQVQALQNQTPQAQSTSGTTGQSSGNNTSATAYPPSINVTVPYGVPIYTNPSGYQYYNNPSTGQPVYISPTANVYNPTVNYGTTTSYPTTGTTSGTGTSTPTTNQANIPSSGTVNTSGSGYVETPQGTASYDHSGSTSYGSGQGNSTGQTSFETPSGQSYETGHGNSANTQRSGSSNNRWKAKSRGLGDANGSLGDANGSLGDAKGGFAGSRIKDSGFANRGPKGSSNGFAKFKGPSPQAGVSGHSGHSMSGRSGMSGRSAKGMGGMHKPSGGAHASLGHKGGGRRH